MVKHSNDSDDKFNNSFSSLKSSPLHTLIKNSKIAAIFILDEKGTIIEINSAVTKYFGYEGKDVIAKNFSLLFTKEDNSKGYPKKELSTVLKQGSASDNNYIVHKNGNHIWVHGESILGKDESGSVFIFKIIYDLSTQHTLEKNLISLNNELNNFVYIASHDLKAPINNLDGLLTALKDSYKKNENPLEIIHMMEQSVSKFRGILKELALTGQKQEQKGQNDISLIQFEKMVEEVLSNLQDLIKKNNASIEYDFSLATEIDFSKKNLRSILHNLLSNAIKYYDPTRKPEIFISTKKTQEYLILKVKDNGVGINEKNMKKLFTIYERFNTEIEGAGVGLAIVKRIIENSEGKIEVKSKEGEGSTFSVYFKLENN